MFPCECYSYSFGNKSHASRRNTLNDGSQHGQMESIVSEVMSRINIIKRPCYHLDRKSLAVIYFSVIGLISEYANVLYDSSEVSDFLRHPFTSMHTILTNGFPQDRYIFYYYFTTNFSLTGVCQGFFRPVMLYYFYCYSWWLHMV